MAVVVLEVRTGDKAPDRALDAMIDTAVGRGLNSAVGSISRAVWHVLGTKRIDLFITSVAADQTRHYRFVGPLNQDAIDARVWSGLHFRTADVIGNHTAQAVATSVFRNAFRAAH